jgi:Inorganic pyrophosphatase
VPGPRAFSPDCARLIVDLRASSSSLPPHPTRPPGLRRGPQGIRPRPDCWNRQLPLCPLFNIDSSDRGGRLQNIPHLCLCRARSGRAPSYGDAATGRTRARSSCDRQHGEDGHPLDALVLVGEPTFPDCVIRVGSVGLFEVSDEEGPVPRSRRARCVTRSGSEVESITDRPSSTGFTGAGRPAPPERSREAFARSGAGWRARPLDAARAVRRGPTAVARRAGHTQRGADGERE